MFADIDELENVPVVPVDDIIFVGCSKDTKLPSCNPNAIGLVNVYPAVPNILTIVTLPALFKYSLTV